jgi:hypothetical protein
MRALHASVLISPLSMGEAASLLGRPQRKFKALAGQTASRKRSVGFTL